MNFKDELNLLKFANFSFEEFDHQTRTLQQLYDPGDFINKLDDFPAPDLRLLNEDKSATSLIPAHRKDHLKALRSSADGNCLFNSISLCLVGSEVLADELRLRTCVELAQNVPFYTRHPTYVELQIPSISEPSSFLSVDSIHDVASFWNESSMIYKEQGIEAAMKNEIMLTANNYTSSTMLPLMAVASVVGLTVSTLFPEESNQYLDAFQNSFKPRQTARSPDGITLLWTSTNGWPDRSLAFRPNHFVPLIQRDVPLSAWPIGSSRKHMPKQALGEQLECSSFPPLAMPRKWYGHIGRITSGNEKRNEARKERRNEAEEIESAVSGGRFKALRSSLDVNLKDAISSLKQNASICMTDKAKRLVAIAKCGEYIMQQGPIVETQKLVGVYRKELSLAADVKTMSLTFFETISKHLPVCQIYLGKNAYLLEDRLQAIELVSVTSKIMENEAQSSINAHLRERIGIIYKDALDYMDTKRDKDVLRAILAKISSIRFAARLEGKGSWHGVRGAVSKLEADLGIYKDIKITSQVVRNDMTNAQQNQLTRRIASKRKHTQMRTIAEGRGCHLKCDEFPDLAATLECLFTAEGLESHPRLTDSVLYRAKSNNLTMEKAREALLSVSPKGFSISLSTCYNYTQNFKAGTAQAKRHHEGRNINACISLHTAPRTSVAQVVANLHWSSANINSIIESAIEDKDDSIIDSKDAKNIVCADIQPVQHPGKTWKKREGVAPDHSWDQSRRNAVTPMAHLFLSLSPSNTSVGRTSDPIIQVTRSGQAAVLVNISLYEPSTSFRALNELLLMLTLPQFFDLFLNKVTQSLKKKFIFVVDNGPAEQPSSPLVQMMLVRLSKYLQLEKAEYNSKRNFVERVHAEENKLLSRHGPFSSTMVHAKNNTDVKHRENMEAMTMEVVTCLKSCQYAQKPVIAERGVKDKDYVFDDEEQLKEFLKFTEAKKADSELMYSVNESSHIHKKLVALWSLDAACSHLYSDDYAILHDEKCTWNDKYTFCSVQNDESIRNKGIIWQPIPDYVRWHKSGELHYLPLDIRQQLPEGIWDNEPGLFLPTAILETAYSVYVDVPEEVVHGLAFLCWCPEKEVKLVLEEHKERASEDSRNDNLREKLQQTELYQNTKAQLAKMCSELNLQTKGTKLQLAERLAKAKKVNLEEDAIPLYAGDLTTIPSSLVAIRKFSLGKCAKM
eukprot:Seg568.7 transcript_id=Seg568.7/GoldUCD/mRNA.D3Y31 product=Vertnin protein_id=Seg568.7/GoldUCD/D3Y31